MEKKCHVHTKLMTRLKTKQFTCVIWAIKWNDDDAKWHMETGKKMQSCQYLENLIFCFCFFEIETSTTPTVVSAWTAAWGIIIIFSPFTDDSY